MLVGSLLPTGRHACSTLHMILTAVLLGFSTPLNKVTTHAEIQNVDQVSVSRKMIEDCKGGISEVL